MEFLGDPSVRIQDLFINRSPDDDRNVSLARIPSSLSQGALKEWNLVLPFHDPGYIASTQDNLLVVVERGAG